MEIVPSDYTVTLNPSLNSAIIQHNGVVYMKVQQEKITVEGFVFQIGKSYKLKLTNEPVIEVCLYLI